MAKKIKPVNQFAAPSEGVQAGAPVETPAPKVKINKDGSERKVRGPSGPRTVNPKIKEFTDRQATDLALFKANQRTAKQEFFKKLCFESKTAKAATKMEKTLLSLNPEERAWLLKANAEKLAAAGAPELEQQP